MRQLGLLLLLSLVATVALADEPTNAAPPAKDESGATVAPAKKEWLKNRIRWSTASEVDNFGYDVFRGPKEEGPFEKVNIKVIPGHGTTDEPQQYAFFDDTIEPKTEYWYYVESISIQGHRERFTPIFMAKGKVDPAEDAPNEAVPSEKAAGPEKPAEKPTDG
jgi:hypothetical protein